MRRPQGAKLGARSIFHARQCALVQRDVAMRVDEAGQDELARRVDDRVFRALRPEPAIYSTYEYELDDGASCEANPSEREKVLILGRRSEPHRRARDAPKPAVRRTR